MTGHKEQLLAEQGIYKSCEADECRLRTDMRKTEKEKNEVEEQNHRLESK